MTTDLKKVELPLAGLGITQSKATIGAKRLEGSMFRQATVGYEVLDCYYTSFVLKMKENVAGYKWPSNMRLSVMVFDSSQAAYYEALSKTWGTAAMPPIPSIPEGTPSGKKLGDRSWYFFEDVSGSSLLKLVLQKGNICINLTYQPPSHPDGVGIEFAPVTRKVALDTETYVRAVLKAVLKNLAAM